MMSDTCSDGTVVAFLAKTWALLNVRLKRCRIPITRILSAGMQTARSFVFSTWICSKGRCSLRGSATGKLKASFGRYILIPFSLICMALRRSSEPSILRASSIPTSLGTTKARSAWFNGERNAKKTSLAPKITPKNSNPPTNVQLNLLFLPGRSRGKMQSPSWSPQKSPKCFRCSRKDSQSTTKSVRILIFTTITSPKGLSNPCLTTPCDSPTTACSIGDYFIWSLIYSTHMH